MIPHNSPIPPHSLALFDLDNTLLGGDSDYLWGQFLVEQGLVNAEEYETANRRFFEDYQQGILDIRKFLHFSLKPLSANPPNVLHRLRDLFITEKIEPIVLPAAKALVEHHRQRGDHLVIITATNAFVTAPIAELFGIDDLIATQPEYLEDRYTGRFIGTPCFREGKVKRLNHWLDAHQLETGTATFYSDSHNDLPLLNQVGHPVAVDPDPQLEHTARRHGWPVLTLRQGTEPIVI